MAPRGLGPRSAGRALTIVAFGTSLVGGAQASAEEVGLDLLPLVEATLAGEKKVALEALSSSTFSPEDQAVIGGLVHLIFGERAEARKLLGAPRLAAYAAMAEVGRPGGLGRAKERLAKRAVSPDAEPEVLFLAALAFFDEGRAEQADALLIKALEKAKALSPAFAPDPAVALAREVIRLGADKEKVALALEKSGRPGAFILEREPAEKKRLFGAAKPKGVEAAASVEDAEERLRNEPQSDLHRAALIDALIKDGKVERAQALTLELLERKSSEVDPYARLAIIADLKGDSKKAEVQRLRSKAHREALDRRRNAQDARVRALFAVADAESGVGIAGLDAQRGEMLQLSLPFDLAIARAAKAGTARAARERVLGACRGRLEAFLSHTGTWDRFTLELSLYGRPVRLESPLPAADPARCAGR